MRACGPGEFRASLEAQLLMVARRLSHRVVAIGFFPPSSDSWHPTHTTHKFTRAPAWGKSHLDELVSPLGGPPRVENRFVLVGVLVVCLWLPVLDLKDVIS